MLLQSGNLLHTDSGKGVYKQAELKLRQKKESVRCRHGTEWAGYVGPHMRTDHQINGRPEHSPLVQTAAARGPIYRSPYLPLLTSPHCG